MSRIINPDSAGRERNHLTRSIVLAVRELGRQTEPGTTSRDLAAYIVLALTAIAGTIDVSVAAWEKRGYWVKADRFRMDWIWTGQYAASMRQALLAGDWATVAQIATQIALKLHKITIPAGHRIGEPWIGAWKELQSRS